MSSLWFVVPVYGRLQLAQICLRQLRRTCDALISEDIASCAVIIGDQDDIDAVDAHELGFATVVRDNQFTSRKFNDGIQLAADPQYNPHPADYVVPCGSDDWVDHKLFRVLPPPDTVYGFQQMSFVREDGQEISSTFLGYQGGAGIRIIPRQLLEVVGYRPADEYRERGCDTSILSNLRVENGDRMKVEHRHMHDRQIVDWKTRGVQLNPYDAVTRLRRSEAAQDPFEELAPFYPVEALDEMRALYALETEAAAA